MEHLHNTIQVHVTNKCNLRCEYCYIKFNERSMTLDDFKAQLPYADQLSMMFNSGNKHPTYWVSYFGGEPLLNIDVIFQIDDYLRSINFPSVGSHIQTNSMLLTPEIDREVRARGIAMSYSFDGLTDTPESIVVHEQQLASGLIDHNAKIMVDGSTISKLIDNYRYFLNLGFMRPDFSFVRDNVWPAESIVIAERQIHKLVDELVRLTLSTNYVHVVGFIKLCLTNVLAAKFFGRREFTCFAAKNGFAFTPDRIIYPCSRFYANDEYRLADANLGVVYGDTVAELATKLSVCSATECNSCSIAKYCNTGCAYTQLVNGDNQRMVPAAGYCSLLDVVYRESMRFYRELRDLDVFKEFIKKEVGGEFVDKL